MAIKLDPDATDTDIKKTLASKKKRSLSDSVIGGAGEGEGRATAAVSHARVAPSACSRGPFSGATAAGAGSNKACGRWRPLDVRADVLLRGAL